MIQRPKAYVWMVLISAVLAAATVGVAQGPAPESVQNPSVDVRTLLPSGARSLRLESTPSGNRHRWVVTGSDGVETGYSPEAFAELVYSQNTGRPWWGKLMNIETPLGMFWVGLGLLGQLIFTGRMLLQWLASEKARRSVVPEAFWWMSLAGATMLLIYFIWRWDIVGILGQATGWLIYVRNLYLIRWSRGATSDEAA